MKHIGHRITNPQGPSTLHRHRKMVFPLDFQRDESKLGTGEVWLGYVLGREGAS